MGYTKKFTIILDIDNTIMTSYDESEINIDLLKKYNLNFIKDKNIYFVERPHIQTLLDFVFKYFNVIIWTAATRSYALQVIKHIILNKPNRKIELLLSRDICNFSFKKYQNMKQLKLLWIDLNLTHLNESNVLLIDDLYNNCKYQEKNCIWIPPFDINNIYSIRYNAIEPIMFYLEKILKYNHIPSPSIRYHNIT